LIGARLSEGRVSPDFAGVGVQERLDLYSKGALQLEAGLILSAFPDSTTSEAVQLDLSTFRRSWTSDARYRFSLPIAQRPGSRIRTSTFRTAVKSAVFGRRAIDDHRSMSSRTPERCGGPGRLVDGELDGRPRSARFLPSLFSLLKSMSSVARSTP